MKLRRSFDDVLAVKKKDANTTKTWRLFWNAHQRFFKYMCIAAKVERAIQVTKEWIERDHAVVIGLQSTGEAQINNEFEDEDDIESLEFVSPAE